MAKQQNRNRNRNKNKSRTQLNTGRARNRNRNINARRPQSQSTGGGLYDTTQLLSKKALRNAVRSLVNQEIRPSMREAGRQIGQIQAERDRQIEQAQLLQQQATRNMGNYYARLASAGQQALTQDQATGQALTSAVGAQGAQTQQAITQAGQTATAGIGPYPGQEISARDQLAQLVAQQTGGAAREQAALNAQAQAQSAGFTQLQSGINQANQMTGAAQRADIINRSQTQIGDIRSQTGQDISKLRGTQADLLAQRPDLMSKAALDLRQSEQNYLLSLGALKLDRKKLASEVAGKTGGIAYSNVSTKNYMKLNKQKAKLERERIRLQNKANHSLLTQKQQDRLDYLNKAAKSYGGNKGSGSKAGGYQPRGKVFSYLRGKVQGRTLVQGISAKGQHRTAKQARTAAYDMLRAFGATDKDARWAIKRLIKHYKGSQMGHAQAGGQAVSGAFQHGGGGLGSFLG